MGVLPHNISYAEIRPLLDLRISQTYASLRGYDFNIWKIDTLLVSNLELESTIR